MTSLTVAIDIAASADRVWSVLTDLDHFGDWNPFIREASGSLAVGGTVHVHVRSPIGLPLRFSATVLACEPGRELRWRGTFLAARLAGGEHAFVIEPLGPGRVRFIQREEFSGWLPRLVSPLLRSQTRRGFDQMNRALKARAEKSTSWMLGARPSGPAAPYHARFESIGAKLPERRLTTPELMASTRHHNRIDLERLTGIRERRVCGPDETSLTLAIDAARDCLARSRYTADDLDVVINASITRDVGGQSHRFEPPLNLSIREAIGAHRAFGFDLSNACAGMLTGVFLLDSMIRRGQIRRGMVVSGEHISGLGSNAARDVRSIFSLQLASLTLGDAGAAVIVDRAPADRPGILAAGFTTLAEHSRLCVGLPAAHQPGAHMYTRARAIHDVAMADGPVIVGEILDQHGLRLDDIDWFIPHQTSVRAVRSGERVLAKHLGGHPGHVVVTVDEYGNTASTTLFLALHRYLTEGQFQSGDRIMLLSVASGLEVGVVLFEMDELKETHGHAN